MIIRRPVCFSVLVLALFLGSAVVSAQAQKFPAGSYQSGPFMFVIEEGGSYRVAHTDGRGVTGTYKVSGDRIDLTDQGGELACDGLGKYSWKTDGEALVFSLVEDPCDGRTQALTSGPLVKDRLAGQWKGTWEQTGGQSGTFQMTFEKKSDGSAGTIRVEMDGAELYSAAIKEASLNGNKMAAKYEAPNDPVEILLEAELTGTSLAGTWAFRPIGESASTPVGSWKATRQ